jgi:hypothetical protein
MNDAKNTRFHAASDIAPAVACQAAVVEEIRKATRRAVRNLAVLVSTDGVRLRGDCPTFTCKRDCQEAAKRVIGRTRLVNQIEVVGPADHYWAD